MCLSVQKYPDLLAMLPSLLDSAAAAAASIAQTQGADTESQRTSSTTTTSESAVDENAAGVAPPPLDRHRDDDDLTITSAALPKGTPLPASSNRCTTEQTTSGGALASAVRVVSGAGASFILDAEVVAVDPQTGRILPFQTLSTRGKKARLPVPNEMTVYYCSLFCFFFCG